MPHDALERGQVARAGDLAGGDLAGRLLEAGAYPLEPEDDGRSQGPVGRTTVAPLERGVVAGHVDGQPFEPGEAVIGMVGIRVHQTLPMCPRVDPMSDRTEPSLVA